MLIDAFMIDEDNEAKFWQHGLAADDILQVIDGPHIIERNRKERRASHLVIGRDRAGVCIAVPVESTHDRRVWRPVTAWRCKESEQARLSRHE